MTLAFFVGHLPAQEQKAVRLGMHVVDFLQSYPDMAPKSLRYSGNVSQDTVWHGLNWTFHFAFTRGTIGGCRFLSEPVPPEELGRLHEATESISSEFRHAYGIPTMAAPEKQMVPPKMSDGSLAEVPLARYWVRERTRWNLRVVQHPDHPPGHLSLQLELLSTTRSGPGQLPFDAPLYAGMPIERFAAVFPEVFIDGIGYRGPLERMETIGHIQGIWTYWFDRGLLQEYRWERSFPVAPEERPGLLDTTLVTADALIDSYNKALPGAMVMEEGKPEEQVYRHARWVLPEEELEVRVEKREATAGLGFFIRLSVRSREH